MEQQCSSSSLKCDWINSGSLKLLLTWSHRVLDLDLLCCIFACSSSNTWLEIWKWTAPEVIKPDQTDDFYKQFYRLLSEKLLKLHLHPKGLLYKRLRVGDCISDSSVFSVAFSPSFSPFPPLLNSSPAPHWGLGWDQSQVNKHLFEFNKPSVPTALFPAIYLLFAHGSAAEHHLHDCEEQLLLERTNATAKYDRQHCLTCKTAKKCCSCPNC